MKTILISKDLWDYIEDGFEEPQDPAALDDVARKILKENRKRNAKALSFIQQGLSRELFSRIMRTIIAKEAWEIIQKKFQGDLKVKNINLQTLRRELENSKMKESEGVQNYYTRLMSITNQMRSLGEEIRDSRVVEKILVSLPPSYDSMVIVVEETKDILSLTIEDVMGSLKAYEKRMERHSEKSIESAFQTKLNLGTKEGEKNSESGDQKRGNIYGGQGRGRGRSSRGGGRYNVDGKRQAFD
ncbi:uncharacterized protein LOC127240534 [Andrographis paniculata]|uniref:uncharacterized protein LOC127240534 n=1 Tax=Andrographis paniculata TaxID=175694 RepID=UPI0021E7BB6B|nr:uncharacterized protein LOC127240534 [Andrographis paniculata]